MRHERKISMRLLRGAWYVAAQPSYEMAKKLPGVFGANGYMAVSADPNDNSTNTVRFGRLDSHWNTYLVFQPQDGFLLELSATHDKVTCKLSGGQEIVPSAAEMLAVLMRINKLITRNALAASELIEEGLP